MSSLRAPSRILFPAILLLTAWAMSGCDDAPDPPDLKAGIITPEDLPGRPEPKLLSEDSSVSFTCGVNGEMQLQDDASDTSFVEYVLDDETTVRSALYTYADHPVRLGKDWDWLRSGNNRCPKLALGDPDGGYAVITNLPATATGYDTTTQDDYSFTHAQRAWARRGTESIVSVTVIREVKRGDAGPNPKLPVSAAALAQKAARR